MPAVVQYVPSSTGVPPGRAMSPPQRPLQGSVSPVGQVLIPSSASVPAVRAAPQSSVAVASASSPPRAGQLAEGMVCEALTELVVRQDRSLKSAVVLKLMPGQRVTIGAELGSSATEDGDDVPRAQIVSPCVGWISTPNVAPLPPTASPLPRPAAPAAPAAASLGPVSAQSAAGAIIETGGSSGVQGSRPKIIREAPPVYVTSAEAQSRAAAGSRPVVSSYVVRESAPASAMTSGRAYKAPRNDQRATMPAQEREPVRRDDAQKSAPAQVETRTAPAPPAAALDDVDDGWWNEEDGSEEQSGPVLYEEHGDPRLLMDEDHEGYDDHQDPAASGNSIAVKRFLLAQIEQQDVEIAELVRDIKELSEMKARTAERFGGAMTEVENALTGQHARVEQPPPQRTKESALGLKVPKKPVPGPPVKALNRQTLHAIGAFNVITDEAQKRPDGVYFSEVYSGVVHDPDIEHWTNIGTRYVVAG